LSYLLQPRHPDLRLSYLLQPRHPDLRSQLLLLPRYSGLRRLMPKQEGANINGQRGRQTRRKRKSRRR